MSSITLPGPADSPERFVLWCLDGTTARLHPPAALLTGAPRALVARFMLQNPWAAALPRWRFCPVNTSDAAVGKGTWGAAVQARPRRLFIDGGDDLAMVVPEGAAERVPLPWRELADVPPGDPRRVNVVVAAAAAIARAVGGPVWEIEAEHTGAALAVGIAMAQGRAVAVGPGVPGPFTAAVSTAHGVSVKTVVDADAMRRELQKREKTR